MVRHQDQEVAVDRGLLTTASGPLLEGTQAQVANPGQKHPRSSGLSSTISVDTLGLAGAGAGRGLASGGPGKGPGGGEGSRPHTHGGRSP